MSASRTNDFAGCEFLFTFDDSYVESIGVDGLFARALGCMLFLCG